MTSFWRSANRDSQVQVDRPPPDQRAPDDAQPRGRQDDRASATAADATAPGSARDTDARSSVIIWSIPLNSVEALLRHRSFVDRLTSGLVFVQNKRPMADLLLALAEQVYGPGVRFRRLHESRAGAEAVVDALCLKRPSRGSGSAGVTVLDCDSVPSGLPKTLTRVAAAPGLRRGLWVRGHVRDLHPAHLRVFDVLFLMDMSDVEMEMVRSLIPVSPACADQLRERVESSIFPPEHLLVFTAGTDRTTGARLPEVARNPALLRLTEDDLDSTRTYSMLRRA